MNGSFTYAAFLVLCFPLQIKFLKMEMEKKTKIIKDLQQEVANPMIYSLELNIIKVFMLHSTNVLTLASLVMMNCNSQSNSQGKI